MATFEKRDRTVVFAVHANRRFAKEGNKSRQLSTKDGQSEDLNVIDTAATENRALVALVLGAGYKAVLEQSSSYLNPIQAKGRPSIAGG